MVRAGKEALVRQVRDLEVAALGQEDDPELAYACLQDARFLTESTQRVYAELQRRGARVLLLGRGLRAWLPHGLPGVDLADDDPLGDEWLIVVRGSRPVCLVARDLPSDVGGDDAHRTFEYAVTHDPELVDEVAALLATYA